MARCARYARIGGMIFAFSEKGSCRLHSINVKIESGKLVKRYPRTMARDTCGSYKAIGGR